MIESRPLLRVFLVAVLALTTVLAVGRDDDARTAAIGVASEAPAGTTAVPGTDGPEGEAGEAAEAEAAESGRITAAVARQIARAVLLLRLQDPDRDAVGVMTEHGSEAEIDAFAEAVGRQPDIVSVAIGWATDRFDPTLVDRIRARGAVPMISWEPYDHRNPQEPGHQPGFAIADILAGTYDAYIDEWAAGLAAEGTPVVIRFAHEMNGHWYPWSELAYDNPPGSYVALWRYVHDRVTAAGATNVIWLWSPNVAYPGSAPIAGFYPGDEWVDLVGVVGYFGHSAEAATRAPTFDEIFGPTLAELATITDRPVMISETAGTERGGFKAEWVAGFLAEVAARPDVTGFVWFDVLKEADWRVDSTPAAIDAFRAGLQHPAYTWSDPGG